MEKLKVVLLLSLAFLFCSQTNAQTVSVGDAKAKALEFFSNGAKKLPAKNGAKRQAPAVSNVELAYTSQKDGRTCFYVFNNGTDGGFVIIGGDEAAKEILAYVPQGHFDYDKAPDNLKWWLSQYEQEISFAQNTEVQTSQVSAPQRIVQTKETTSYREQFTDIPDMITTKWGQGEYFNNAIPLIGDEHPVTGCVATALAQIMKYWNYPSEGKGSIENGEYSVNFAEATYDWDNMLDDYYLGEPTQTQIDAVSQLMYHIGASLGSNYSFGIYATGYTGFEGYKYKTILQNSLEDHFGYSTNNTHLLRDGVCDEDWECIIYSELSAGRPIFYAGTSNTDGHAFVCHGYSSALGMFAFNWGWNGSEDGYYALSSTDGVNGFTSNQWILTGFEPEGRQHRNQIEYGDRFTADGYNYSVHNPILKRAALAPVLSDEYSVDVEVSGSVSYQGTNFDVTHIGQFVLSAVYNGYISSISLPNSILSFGASAFMGARGVHELKLPANLKKIGKNCFSTVEDLDSITIPDGVTVINENCFAHCHSLKSINLHDNITSLGYGCFSNCESLKELTIPNGIKYLDQIIYGSNSLLKITLPSTIESLNFWCFKDCSKLSYLYCNSIEVPQVLSETFPENIKTGVLFVPQSAIEAYSNAEFWKNWGTIEAIETAKETNYLGESFEVDGIQYSVIANGVVVEKCITRQPKIVIPQRVEYKGELFDVLQIGTYAFYNYDENDVLETVVLPEGLKVIADHAFYRCFHLKHINLPESIIEIGASAFFFCLDLDNVIIPSTIKTIKSNTFNSCLNLKNVYLGDNVQILEPYSFEACLSLSKVIIPQSVILLYGASFVNCPNLTEMYSFSPKIYSWQDWMDIFKPDVYVFDKNAPIASNQANATLYVQNEYISNYEGYSIWQGWGNILPMVPLTEINILDNLALNVGQSQTMDMTILPSNASVPNCKWTSSDPTIASVDYNGVVTAHKAGTATITATGMYYLEISSSCSVTVTAALPKGDVNGDQVIDIADVNCIINVILENAPASNFNGRADVNGDGTIDIADINTVIAIILGN